MKAKLVQAEADWNRAQMLGPPRPWPQPPTIPTRPTTRSPRPTSPWTKPPSSRPAPPPFKPRPALDKSQRTLDYCTITSPVKGVIIDRRVTIGETVVSSFNTPSLFLIAKDLTRMQVWISVNEADIGSIYPGQPVTFTVDAFPNRVFPGQGWQNPPQRHHDPERRHLHRGGQHRQSDGKLLPYLTANAQFLTGERHQVLLVPNAALRWRPASDFIAPAARAAGARRPRQTQIRLFRVPPSGDALDRRWQFSPACSGQRRLDGWNDNGNRKQGPQGRGLGRRGPGIGGRPAGD